MTIRHIRLFAFLGICFITLFGINAASAETFSCGSNEICLYDGAGYSGSQLNIDVTNPIYHNTYIYLNPNYSGVTVDFNNKLTSLINNTPYSVLLGAGAEIGSTNVSANNPVDLSGTSYDNKVYYLYITTNGVTLPTSTPTSTPTPPSNPTNNSCNANEICLYDGADYSGSQLAIDATNPIYHNTYIYLNPNYSGVTVDFNNILTSLTNNTPYTVLLGAGAGIGSTNVVANDSVDLSGTSYDNKVYYLYITTNGVTLPTSTPTPTPTTPSNSTNNCGANQICLYDGANYTGVSLAVDGTNSAYHNTYVYLNPNYSGMTLDFNNKLTSLINNTPYSIQLGAGAEIGSTTVGPNKMINLAGTAFNNQVYYLYITNNGVTLPTSTPTATPSVSSTADTDGDGLLDIWETSGYDANNDGVIDVNLPAMGADPQHKDIFIEIDYMVGSAFTHKPIAQGIQEIVTAFANASDVTNPDGTSGIRLHVDYGPDAPLTYGAGSTWGNLSSGNALSYVEYFSDCSNGFSWNSFDTTKANNFPSERTPIFHYNLWLHRLCPQWGTVSGLSRNNENGSAFTDGASDFIVSLGDWTNQVGTQNQQAGTFMHELGHNLGLRHGGTNHNNFKPNYFSVMNYGFQTVGLQRNGVEFDYSRYSNIPALNESSLNENSGLSLPSNFEVAMTIHRCFNAQGLWYIESSGINTIDWNCNGTIGGTASIDLDNSGNLNVVTGQNDWLNITFFGGAVGDTGAAATRSQSKMPMVSNFEELTYEEAQTVEQSLEDNLLNAAQGTEPTNITLQSNSNQKNRSAGLILAIMLTLGLTTALFHAKKA